MACADEFISPDVPTATTPTLEQGGCQRLRRSEAAPVHRPGHSPAAPGCLILDDSTSAVDTATRRERFVSALRQATCPGLYQAHHRPAHFLPVIDADLIVVLDDGKVSGAGTHDQLMASNHIYQEVYKSQQEGATIDG